MDQTWLTGWYGATLYLTGQADIEATLIGYEAGYTNTFSFGGDTLSGGGGMDTNASGLDAFTILGVAPGMLNFSFSTTGDGGHSVANGANPDNTVPSPSPGVNFFTSFDDPSNPSGAQLASGNIVYLFFDDDGANNDDNHDDLVVRLAIVGGNGGFVAPVPVPAGGLLLLGGLAGLAALRRRRNAA